jgi:hypothetical protein
LGNFGFVNRMHPLKALAPIEVMPSPSETLFSLKHPLNDPLPKVCTLSPNVTDTRRSQLAKALLPMSLALVATNKTLSQLKKADDPIEVTPLPISRLSMLEHPEYASCPMLVTLLGITRRWILVQPWNTAESIEVNPLPKKRLSMPEQPWNAHDPMSVTLFGITTMLSIELRP